MIRRLLCLGYNNGKTTSTIDKHLGSVGGGESNRVAASKFTIGGGFYNQQAVKADVSGGTVGG